jgi:hypothetical protein
MDSGDKQRGSLRVFESGITCVRFMMNRVDASYQVY